MKVKSLIIALAITLSPIIQAGPIKWIKDHTVPIAIGIAGVSAVTMIYLLQPGDNEKTEISNHSPTNEQPSVEDRYMLELARTQSAQRTSRTTAHINNGNTATEESGNHTIVESKVDSILPKAAYDPNARPIKSSLRNANYEPVNQLFNANAPDTTAFKEALAQAIETDRKNLNQKNSESCILSLCKNNKTICAFYSAKSLCFNRSDIPLTRRIEWAQDLLTDL
jgi:hypothetical protein